MVGAPDTSGGDFRKLKVDKFAFKFAETQRRQRTTIELALLCLSMEKA
jgi:hypothetical protein